MPQHGYNIDLEDAALDVTTETMKQEAMRYNIGVEFNLHDHAQILDLLQLLAHIHQPNGVFDINFPDDDDTEGMDENEGDEGIEVDIGDGNDENEEDEINLNEDEENDENGESNDDDTMADGDDGSDDDNDMDGSSSPVDNSHDLD